MTFKASRPDWLSEIVEAKWRGAIRPTPLLERKVQRDAIIAAALGVAHNAERHAMHNSYETLVSPTIQASHFVIASRGRGRINVGADVSASRAAGDRRSQVMFVRRIPDNPAHPTAWNA